MPEVWIDSSITGFPKHWKHVNTTYVILRAYIRIKEGRINTRHASGHKPLKMHCFLAEIQPTWLSAHCWANSRAKSQRSAVDKAVATCSIWSQKYNMQINYRQNRSSFEAVILSWKAVWSNSYCKRCAKYLNQVDSCIVSICIQICTHIMKVKWAAD